MGNNIEFKNRIISFIDILGFSEILKSLSGNVKRHNRLHDALKRIKHIEDSAQKKCSIVSEFEVTVFSDCIAISTEEKGLFNLIWTVGWLQAELLYLGVLTRGAVSSGLLYHSDGIMYGEGFLSAYNIEQKSAIYPRVVVSNKLIQKHKNNILPFLALDFDGLYYIDLFKFDVVAGCAEELAADGYDPRAIYFKEVRDRLIENKNDATEENYLAKQQWMINKFNNAINEFNINSTERIEMIR